MLEKGPRGCLWPQQEGNRQTKLLDGVASRVRCLGEAVEQREPCGSN
jgi:hypothetical protein